MTSIYLPPSPKGPAPGVAGELITRQPGRKLPKASTNPMQDAVRATNAVALACEHLRNLSGADSGAWRECLPDIRVEMRRLSVLLSELEGQQ